MEKVIIDPAEQADEELSAVMDELHRKFMRNINRTIAKNLKPGDAVKFKRYLELEKELSKKINVQLDTTGVQSRAVILLYGEKEFKIME
jgi:hypothetical protein